jgi:hypothetical protein
MITFDKCNLILMLISSDYDVVDIILIFWESCGVMEAQMSLKPLVQVWILTRLIPFGFFGFLLFCVEFGMKLWIVNCMQPSSTFHLYSLADVNSFQWIYLLEIDFMICDDLHFDILIFWYFDISIFRYFDFLISQEFFWCDTSDENCVIVSLRIDSRL